MGKIATKAKTLIKNVAYDVKNHWRVPKKGEYIPYREVVAYTIGVTGNDATNYIEEIVQFSASAFLVGAIMGISYTDIAIIGIITQIMSFALVFMQPFNILIFENHGRLERKTLIAMHSLNFAQVAVGVALMFVSPVPFEALIKGLPQIIACELFGNVIFFYFNYIIRRLFSAKYGRYKPQLIALGWPTALIFLAIVYLPYDTMDYTTLLVVISFLFTCLNRFLNTYQTHSDDIINVMTPNSDERQKFLSIIPIVTGILGSVYRIGFPIVAQATGGLLNIMSYRVFIPLLTLFSILVGLFILPCKERVIEDVENRPKVEFWRGAKKVLRSKNIWMIQLAASLFLLGAMLILGILPLKYMLGLAWIMRYYCTGCASWDWFYPEHYAPLLRDLSAMNNVTVSFALGQPISKLEAVIAVIFVFLPRSSRHARRSTRSSLPSSSSSSPRPTPSSTSTIRSRWAGVIGFCNV